MWIVIEPATLPAGHDEKAYPSLPNDDLAQVGHDLPLRQMPGSSRHRNHLRRLEIARNFPLRFPEARGNQMRQDVEIDAPDLLDEPAPPGIIELIPPAEDMFLPHSGGFAANLIEAAIGMALPLTRSAERAVHAVPLLIIMALLVWQERDGVAFRLGDRI